MDIAVERGGGLTVDTLQQCLTSSDSEGICTIDLTEAKEVDLVGLVTVAAVAEGSLRDGLRVDFLEPMDDVCRDFLADMHLQDTLDNLQVSNQLSPRSTATHLDELLRLHRVDSPESIEILSSRLMDVLIGDIHALPKPNPYEAIYEALVELASNAIEHSGRRCGYVAIQSTGPGGHVTIAVADSGIGVRESLTNDHGASNVVTDKQALQLVSRRRSRETDESACGRGIPTVIGSTNAHGGSVILLSGEAIGTFGSRVTDPGVYAVSGAFPGTLAQAHVTI